MNQTRRLARRRERGTAIVELALVLPVFFLLVMGVFDLGSAVFMRTVLANAAQDGARFAVIDPQNVTCIKSIATQLGASASLTNADVTVQLPATVALRQPVTVT